ncbi:hypothetical protein MKX03_036914 [Papaver bracteatum]|nr:hypothetical protein MKX03_036914 [Papaver bracteatum]
MEGISSTIESLTHKSHSISLHHMDFFCCANGSSFHRSPKTSVCHLHSKKLCTNSFSTTDMSSPSNSLENLSFIISIRNKIEEKIQPTIKIDEIIMAGARVWEISYELVLFEHLGSKRTKLGLRDFITLGDFIQIINVSEFSARGFGLLNGQLTIEASFKIASKSLMNLFQKNYDLLLSIFNPEGWLDISYVDDTMRIGRDDKGNIFILERPSTQ